MKFRPDSDHACKKRHYDSDKSRKSLTDAAVDVFSKQGYDAATTRGIAKKAGVNESLIQRYFKSKFGLFSAVIDVCRRKLLESLPYEAAETLEEELRQFFKFRLSFAKKEKKMIRLILSRSLIDQKIAGRMGDVYHNGLPNLIERLEALQQRGKVSKTLNLKTTSLLIASFSFAIALWSHVLASINEEVSQELTELAIRVLSKGLSD